ncbi:MAG TPA: hypothetical protein VFD06_03555 [Candidatus Polarisedimenticolia bacterium]|nr:hypothetical protein [Candidatus Polarisedimenticolia bacterium]
MDRRLNRPVFAVALFLGGLAAAGGTPLRAADPAPPSDQETQDQAKKNPKADPPRRFTDDDLEEKYHRKPQAQPAEEETGAPAAATAGVPAARPPAAPPAGAKAPAAGAPTKPPATATAAATKPPARPGPPPVKKVLSSPTAPTDPLQGYRVAAAKDEARERELKARRERIATLQSRLDYLQAKRNALVNPGATAVGSTGPLVYDYDETTGKPVMDPTTGKPSTKPDISPGRATAPVSPIFPPLPPAQTDEDRENDRKMKVKDLLAAVEKEIPGVEEELARARQDLVDYETRFAAGAP